MHGERIRTRDQDKVSGKRKKHPGAKDREPLLAAFDDRLQRLPSETGPVSRHHVGKQESQREKVKHPERGEIFLVDGKKGIAQEIRDDAGLGKFPCHRHRQSKEQVQPRRGAQGSEPLERTHGAHLCRAAQCQPGTQHKQELPAERVKVPPSVRERRQIPVELTGCEIETDRPRHRSIRPAHHAEQNQRKDRHQHDEQLQHIKVQWLGPKQQAVNQRPDRMVDDTRDIEFADECGRGGLARGISNQIDIDHEQDDIGGV